MADRTGMKRLSALRVIAPLVAGVLAGSIMITPAGAHVTDSVKHLINRHLKKAFYTKKQANKRFVLKADSTGVTGLKNGPGDVASVPSAADPAATIGTLALGKGNYAIFAKLYVEDAAGNPDPAAPPDVTVTCRMEAEADFDETTATVFPASPLAWRSVIALQVGHAFSAAGSAVVKCRDDLAAPNTSTVFRFLKITAIRLGSVSNVTIP
jgi:hypothetical protein